MEQKARVYHWWPGRRWAGPCPIPEPLVEKARERGSRYLTVARAEMEDGAEIVTAAFCCPQDNPSRRIGREIAVGRLASLVDAYIATPPASRPEPTLFYS